MRSHPDGWAGRGRRRREPVHRLRIDRRRHLSRETVAVPFPDEKFAQGVEVVPYRPQWATEGREIAAVLARMLPEARAVDHIGSTSVPGLPAKDCIDLMVRV